MTFGTFELSQLPPAHKGGLEELHLPPRHFNLGSPTFDNSPTYSQSWQLYQGEAVRTGDCPNPRVVVALAWHLPVLHHRWFAGSCREKVSQKINLKPLDKKFKKKNCTRLSRKQLTIITTAFEEKLHKLKSWYSFVHIWLKIWLN